MSLLTKLLLLIVVARLLGRLFERLGQPAIVGEMIAGVLLGPAILGIVEPNEALHAISDLAVFLVVLSAGLEMEFRSVIDSLRGRGLVIAALSFVLPMFAGIAVGFFYHLDTLRSIFLGLCASITALPVAVRILQKFNLLYSDIARYSVATAILNDVTALLALGVLLTLPPQFSLGAAVASILLTAAKLVVLALLILGFNSLVELLVRRGVRIPRWSEKLVEMAGPEALFGILVIFVLAFGSVSEALGFQFVIGAFFGALLIDRRFFLASRFHELDHTLRAVTDGFLGPVFFATIGLEFQAGTIPSVDFALVVLAVSITSKLASGWAGARLVGLGSTDALGIGIMLNGRGVMELVIASIAYRRGFVGQGMFSVLVLMGVVTTVITPILFQRWVLPRLPGRAA